MYNMNILDGIIRMFIGSIIGAVFGAFGMWLGLIAPFFIVTGLGGYCPIYHLLGWSTVEDPETNAHHSEEAPSQSLNSKREANQSVAA
jgi:Protein of unknown function (DUF2892)